MKLKNSVKSYIAGIVDGEGCIVIVVNDNKHLCHVVSLQIGNTDKMMLLFIKKYFGGSLFRANEKNKNGYWKLQLSSKNAINCIKLIYPYLITKRKQAKMALLFQKTKGICTTKPTSKSIVKIREDIKKEISNLNHEKAKGINIFTNFNSYEKRIKKLVRE